MAKLRVLVAEDNYVHAARLEMILEERGYHHLGTYSNAEELLRVFHATKPDLVLLDIELDSNESGIDVAEKINHVHPTPVIFTTARDDKVTMDRATQTEPYAYLIKPIESSGLQAAIELAIYKFGKDQEKGASQEPFTGWSEDLLVRDSFFVKAAGKLEKVVSSEVLWVELAEERYCQVVTIKRGYHIRTSMNSLSSKLDSARFVRIHRKYIVNADKVDSIDEVDFTVEVGAKSLPLGSTYKSGLLKRLKML
ncbi:LytR/AlgR family response regulator transcription factor [Reichenbachiella sp.]|uniref:LytR/AlgR family response regulator transcription factor n=1 Tax=Reichenbachiella sp. TaxID=2184521 RepID=UPI003BAE4407